MTVGAHGMNPEFVPGVDALRVLLKGSRHLVTGLRAEFQALDMNERRGNATGESNTHGKGNKPAKGNSEQPPPARPSPEARTGAIALWRRILPILAHSRVRIVFAFAVRSPRPYGAD